MSIETELQTDEVTESFAARWWTIAVAVVLTAFIPLLGLAWSLALAATQRRDRSVSGVLFLIGCVALGLMLLRASTAGVVG